MFKSKKSNPPSAGEDTARDQGKRQVGAARRTWDQLTESEILESDGRIQKLASLVEGRYGVTLTEAENQVMRFLDKQATNAST